MARTDEPFTLVKTVSVAAFALFMHVTFRDFYLLGHGRTRVYITAHEVLVTLACALCLIPVTITLLRGGSTASFRIAVIVLCIVDTGAIYWGSKVLLYPFEADTIEGNNLLQGVVVWDNPGLLYPDPVLDRAVAGMYPPLSGVLFGSVYRFTGNDVFFPRLINFALILASAVFLTRLIRLGLRERFLIFSGWLVLQIYFCGYLYSLRPDALLVFLLLLGCLSFDRYLREPERKWRMIVCAIFLFLGMLTKQHALFVMAGFITVLSAKRDYRAVLVLITCSSVLFLSVTLWLNSVTHGWYLRTLLLGSHHKLSIAAVSLLAAYLLPMFLIGNAARVAWTTLRKSPFHQPWAWVYSVAGWYLIIAVLALMKGGPGSMNNLAFELALLLPAAAVTIGSQRSGPLTCSILLLVSLPSFIIYQPFAGWLVYAPQQAQEIAGDIQRANGPVLLSRRQGFLLRAGRPVYDDLGMIYFEFAPAGYAGAATRLNQDLQSGRYQLIMLEADEFAKLDVSSQAALKRRYELSDDPSRALFQLRFYRRW